MTTPTPSPTPSPNPDDCRRVLHQARTFDASLIPTHMALADQWHEHLAARTTLPSPAAGGTERDGADYLAPRTVLDYRKNLRIWLRYLAEEARTDQPTTETAIAFRTWCASTRRQASVNFILVAVRGFYAWAHQAGAYPDIAAEVEGVLLEEDEPGDRVPQLSDDEFALLLRTFAGDQLRAARGRALVSLLRACPVDSVAISLATLGDFRAEAGALFLRPRCGRSQVGRGRIAPGEDLVPFALPLPTQVYLGDYLRLRGQLERHAPLLASARDGSAMTTMSMRLVVINALTAAGLRAPPDGISRHAAMFRYPVLTPGDLADLGPRLPADPQEAARLRALLHLIAIPRARINWAHCLVGQVDLRRGCVVGAYATPIDEPTQAAVKDWLAIRPGVLVSDPLFPDPHTGEAVSHHTLKRWAWSAFPERLPAHAAGVPAGSTRRLAG